MIFRNRLKDPKAMIRLGGLFLALALILQMFLHPHPAAKTVEYLSDGVRGLLIGLSIGLNLKAARLIARQRRSGSGAA